MSHLQKNSTNFSAEERKGIKIDVVRCNTEMKIQYSHLISDHVQFQQIKCPIQIK